MALKQPTQLETGYTAEYLRITGIQINFDRKLAYVTLSVYKDQAARLAGNKPVLSRAVQLFETNFPFTVDEMDVKNPVKLAYEKIKTLSDYSAAQDT